jgi:polyisoprenyl-phosphate glycosyltransferase
MSMQLGIVVPCFNEEQVLAETAKRLLLCLNAMQSSGLISEDSSIHFVDDGSKDGTWKLVEFLTASDRRVHGIKMSRNRGHQNALLAGLFTIHADAVVTVDADLQDDVAVIEDMVRAHLGGADIVYGVRKSRSADSVFKRTSASFYYTLLRSLGVDIVNNHADYRLLSRRAVNALREFSEVNLFLRGVIPLLGYPSATISYDRSRRFAGVSKYPLKRMIGFALDGITSFSITPLRLITAMGFLVSVFSFLMVVWVLYGVIVLNSVVPGWASTVIPVYFIGGVQLISVGILGEYVGKIYLEVKRRPRYFVEQVI